MFQLKNYGAIQVYITCVLRFLLIFRAEFLELLRSSLVSQDLLHKSALGSPFHLIIIVKRSNYIRERDGLCLFSFIIIFLSSK